MQQYCGHVQVERQGTIHHHGQGEQHPGGDEYGFVLGVAHGDNQHQYDEAVIEHDVSVEEKDHVQEAKED